MIRHCALIGRRRVPRPRNSRLLLETIPDLERPNRDRRPLGGEVPSPFDQPGRPSAAARGETGPTQGR